MGGKFDWMMLRYQEMYDLFPHINCQIVLGCLISKRLSRKYRQDMIESIYYP